jgi:hypothetical protein
LGQQSKSYCKPEIGEWRRRRVVTADTLRFIAVNGEAPRMSFFAHPLDCLGVSFQNDFPLDFQIIGHILFL